MAPPFFDLLSVDSWPAVFSGPLPLPLFDFGLAVLFACDARPEPLWPWLATWLLIIAEEGL